MTDAETMPPEVTRVRISFGHASRVAMRSVDYFALEPEQQKEFYTLLVKAEGYIVDMMDAYGVLNLVETKRGLPGKAYVKPEEIEVVE